MNVNPDPTPTPTESPYLTLAEAADYARCSTRTIQRRIEQGQLARYGHGAKVLVLQRELEALLSPAGAKL